MSAARRVRGFTLIELLVAMAILAVLGALSYGATQGVLRAREALLPGHQELAGLQIVLAVLESDLESATARAVRDELGGTEAALFGGWDDRLLALTRHVPGWGQAQAVALRRVDYRLQDGRLIRRVWSVLDRVPGSGATEQVLAEDLLEVSVRFHGGQQWQEQWPADRTLPFQTQLPRGVEVVLTFADQRSLRGVFALGSRT